MPSGNKTTSSPSIISNGANAAGEVNSNETIKHKKKCCCEILSTPGVYFLLILQLQFIRNFGRGTKQRRSGIFLALMASEVGSDNNLHRNGLLPSFERFCAKAAVFANPSSNPSPCSNSTYATFSCPITGHPLASSRIELRENAVSGLRLNSSRHSKSKMY